MIHADSYGSTIAGGVQNTIDTGANSATIGGGFLNTIQTRANGTISGGSFNVIQSGAGRATIGGGTSNFIHANADAGSIAGGINNNIQDYSVSSVIGGGDGNAIHAFTHSGTIAGGYLNTISTNADYAVIAGGFQNQVAAEFASIAGGAMNSAFGIYSFAAGRRARALQAGTFVWADSIYADFVSTAANEFAVRATGGVRFVSGVDNNGVPVAGVSLPAGSGSWSTLSDRNAKTHFAPINSRELLDRLAQLPIQTWNYKNQNDSIRHIGPTAQDFHAAFTIGEDDQHIATVDADGVALAAIQGLNQKLEAELNRRDAEIQALRQQLTELKTALGKETTPTKGGSQ
jgi:hypothetical protein